MKTISVLIVVFTISNLFGNAIAQGNNALPHVLVYKAKGHHSNLVPVQLSDDRKTVVSFPDPSDIQTGSSAHAELPVSLHNGYWLDKRGIGLNTAFINMTYAEYAQLKSAPEPDVLFKMIAGENPVTELCDCGVRVKKYSVKQLNQLIDKKRLRKECKVLR
jgi:hypothetical protein